MCGDPQCTCFPKRGLIVCSAGLGPPFTEVPSFDREISAKTTELRLSGNALRQVRPTDLERANWPRLSFVDLRLNPHLNCDTLRNIPPEITVLSDCIQTTDNHFEGSNINSTHPNFQAAAEDETDDKEETSRSPPIKVDQIADSRSLQKYREPSDQRPAPRRHQTEDSLNVEFVRNVMSKESDEHQFAEKTLHAKLDVDSWAVTEEAGPDKSDEGRDEEAGSSAKETEHETQGIHMERDFKLHASGKLPEPVISSHPGQSRLKGLVANLVALQDKHVGHRQADRKGNKGTKGKQSKVRVSGVLRGKLTFGDELNKDNVQHQMTSGQKSSRNQMASLRRTVSNRKPKTVTFAFNGFIKLRLR